MGAAKATLAAIKAPHVIAHVAVATDVKHKSVDALWKTWAAIKATKLAAVSIATAPIRVVAKKWALKKAALKAAKAAKVAKVGRVVDSLKRNPLIVPVPVPVQIPYPVLHKDTLASVNGLLSGVHGSLLQAGHKALPAVGLHAPAVAVAAAQPPAVVQPTPIAQLHSVIANALNHNNAVQTSVAVNSVATSSSSSAAGHLTYGLPRQ